ncbi:MAG: helicase-exonuclease AddAB subunit AddA, partial [Epulopiscium sp.]|nr:helicase-exonuclease AddAB subunit AddA [Candidatus Epulonipiscium sp.]
KGTLFHFVLQHLQLHDALDFQSILSQLQDMVNQGLLTEEEKQVISISHLVSFSRSPLAERMRKALLLKKEVPFVMGVPVETLYSELQVISEEEFILVQGMIDCYFEEEDGIVLVDYKTDFVPDGNIEIIKKRYQIQMDLYTKAIEQITGKKVKEKILYLFSVNETVNV